MEALIFLPGVNRSSPSHSLGSYYSVEPTSNAVPKFKILLVRTSEKVADKL
jgi:hypothetical protein